MERGMKKWRPFKSLVEYDDYYNAMLLERKKISKPLLSEDQIEEINATLSVLKVGDKVTYSYYNQGFIYKGQGQFFYCNIDTSELVIDSLAIPFDNLLSISQN